MRVYRVRGEVNDYQALLAHDSDIWKTDALRLNGTPRTDGWIPPRVYSDQPRLKTPDIWTLVGCAGLVFPEEVIGPLDVILGRAGELLPLPYHGKNLFLLNILQDINCLDSDRSRWVGEEHGRRSAVKTYEFHPNRIPESTLFKIPETDRAEVLCAEGILDREDEFKAVVEDAGWKGLRFQLLWESDR